MTWFYSGDPSKNSKDQVRFLVGDTDSDNQLVSDEEINWAVNNESSVRLAAARVAAVIAMSFGRKADKSVGDLKISYKKQWEAFNRLSDELKSNASLFAVPYAGGISESDKDTVEDDTDRVRPSFKRGMHDNPGVGYQDDDDVCDRNN